MEKSVIYMTPYISGDHIFYLVLAFNYVWELSKENFVDRQGRQKQRHGRHSGNTVDTTHEPDTAAQSHIRVAEVHARCVAQALDFPKYTIFIRLPINIVMKII